MAKIYNKRIHKNIPISAVYVGRPSIYGNPFPLENESMRNECIEKYKEWVNAQPQLIEKIKTNLRGKDLICWCSPSPCHAEILMEIANNL